MTSPPLTVRAAWVLTGAGAPIPDGAVVIGADRRVVWVGPAAEAEGTGRTLEFPQGVVAPGLVNGHTHLELTHLAGLVEAADFPSWIAEVRRLKEASAPDEFDAACRLGLLEMWAQGVTTVADTGSTGAAARALAELGGAGIVYQEVFGPHPAQADDAVAELRQALDALAPLAAGRVRLGVSPHAPYTVSDALARQAADLATARGLPLAMHVAESPEEIAYLRGAAGPFAAAHRRRGIPVAPRGRSSVRWLAGLGLLDHMLCIHGVHIDEGDAELVARHHAAVVHCPRSNAAHRVGQAPLGLWNRAGVSLALGTDSVASLTPLDLRADARATGLGRREQFQLLTAGGARALGLEETGRLSPGAYGDLVVFEDAVGVDPVESCLRGAVRLTTVGGRVVYDGLGWPGVDPTRWRQQIAAARLRLGARASATAPAGSR